MRLQTGTPRDGCAGPSTSTWREIRRKGPSTGPGVLGATTPPGAARRFPAARLNQSSRTLLDANRRDPRGRCHRAKRSHPPGTECEAQASPNRTAPGRRSGAARVGGTCCGRAHRSFPPGGGALGWFHRLRRHEPRRRRQRRWRLAPWRAPAAPRGRPPWRRRSAPAAGACVIPACRVSRPFSRWRLPTHRPRAGSTGTRRHSHRGEGLRLGSEARPAPPGRAEEEAHPATLPKITAHAPANGGPDFVDPTRGGIFLARLHDDLAPVRRHFKKVLWTTMATRFGQVGPLKTGIGRRWGGATAGAAHLRRRNSHAREVG